MNYKTLFPPDATKFYSEVKSFIFCTYTHNRSINRANQIMYQRSDRRSNGSKADLDLEATRSTLTTSLFELATLGADVRLLVLMGTHTEVLDGFTVVLGTTDKDGVGTSGGTESQLIEGDDFTTSLQDASLGSLGHMESGQRQLGQVQKTGVIGDGTDHDEGLVGNILLGSVLGQARHSDRRTVNAGHKETLQDNLVEVSIGTASEETIQLDEER
jgi:hypothetical protein